MISISLNPKVTRYARMYRPNLELNKMIPVNIDKAYASLPTKLVNYLKDLSILDVEKSTFDIEKLKAFNADFLTLACKDSGLKVRENDEIYGNFLSAIIGRLSPSGYLISKYGAKHNEIAVALYNLFNGYKKDFEERLKIFPNIKIDLTGAVFDEAILDNINLSNMILNRSSFKNTILKNVNMHGNLLRDADLYRAGIFDSDFSFVDDFGANLKEAVFVRTNIPRFFIDLASDATNSVFVDCPIVELK